MFPTRPRCTTLSNEGVSVSTVEHLLSALAGLNIDNALIEIEGRETPILDGSALPFVEAILEAGIEELSEPANYMPLKSNIALVSGRSEMNAIPSDRFKILTRTDFDDWQEGDATVEFELSPEAFMKEIAPARTFAFRKEVEMLLAAGLAKGGSLDNALVIDPPNTFSSPLRVSFEWCSHKILDIIGDLALLNARPLMEAKCRRPGHRMNFEFAKEFLRSL